MDSLEIYRMNGQKKKKNFLMSNKRMHEALNMENRVRNQESGNDVFVNQVFVRRPPWAGVAKSCW